MTATKDLRDYHTSSAEKYLSKLRSRFQDQPEKLSSFYKVMHDIRIQINQPDGLKKMLNEVRQRVKSILQGHNDLIDGFNSFLPLSHRVSLDDDDVYDKEEEEEEEEEIAAATEVEIKPGFKDAVDFLKKVKMLRGEKVYENLVMALASLRDGSREDVYRFVVQLLADDPDLLDGFYRFMPISVRTSLAYHVPYSKDLDGEEQRKDLEKVDVCENKDAKIIVEDNGGGFVAEGDENVAEKLKRLGISFFGKVKNSLSCEISYRRFLELFYNYSKEKIGKAEWKKVISSVIGKNADLMDEFNHYVKDCENVCADEGWRFIEWDDDTKTENNHKSIQELARSPYSSKNKEQNRYEKTRFRCQDDRYEMDMLLSWFTSAVEYADEVGKGTDEEKIAKAKQIHFLRCVERLYGDHGLEMLDVFRKDPQLVLPVITNRLKQKLEELKDWRNELQRIWDDAYASIYSKSSDKQHTNSTGLIL